MVDRITEFRDNLMKRLANSLIIVLSERKFVPIITTSRSMGIIKLAEGTDGIEDHVPLVSFDLNDGIYRVFPRPEHSKEKTEVYARSLPLIEQDLVSQGFYRQP